ncbi:hypothetical protein H9P43_007678 [Blastocladiella emersonii ATCC 22665]|nr:hypothetical protein H9P43_007678 [Blastocladiella emersonii ATCC 22665]
MVTAERVQRRTGGKGVALARQDHGGIKLSSVNLVYLLSTLIRMYGQLEASAISVERIRKYTALPSGAPKETSFALDPAWPSCGEIVFKDYLVAYRPRLPLVLKNISLKFEAGKKIGIVGRTGAGKSSLTATLFRLMEAASGTITIDGLDIATLGLHDLRTQLTILPQDAYLMEASIRDNLDPLASRSDAKIWAALDAAHLRDAIAALPGALDAPIKASTLSVGQSQLLCLARAILRKTRVLVLDEATSSIDAATNNLVQETIRREFDSCTVITIAHRIGTIIDYDKILVLDHGEVAEFDTPAALLARPNSVFYSLALESKLVQAIE